MTTISIQEAREKLIELIHGLAPGEEVLITENDQPVARLCMAKEKRKRVLGALKGTVQHVAPDFDAKLDDFREYSE